MIRVKEKKVDKESVFELILEDAGKQLSISRINCYTTVLEKKKQTYFMIYDKYMEPIEFDFNFLNYSLVDQSFNTRRKAMYALKLLHCFESIISKDIKDFSNSDVENFKRFLLGISYSGVEYDFELITTRKNETVNEYLSTYRSYLKEQDADEKHPLFTTKLNVRSFVYNESDVKLKRKTYNSNLKVTKLDEVPPHISLQEFKQIIEVIREKYTVREECIVRLMYESGLRIGEVLGLTFDDVVEGEYVDPDTGEIGYANFVYLRNRTSDKEYQLAKGCVNVISKSQYKTKNYNLENYGYQYVIISKELFNTLNDYIEEAHTAARERDLEKYNENIKADRVRKSEQYEDNNYYIFMNNICGRLSQANWNNTIKKIFIDCNIPLDEEKKKSGLNHRLRHGCAIFNVKYRGMREIEIKEILRHRSIMSVTRYLTQTRSEKIKTKVDFIEDLYEQIPELKND